VRGDPHSSLSGTGLLAEGPAAIDKVTYRFIPDPIVAAASGRVTRRLAFGWGRKTSRPQKGRRFQVFWADSTNDVTLSMNNSKKPYSTKRVRLAITHAINKESGSRGDVRVRQAPRLPTWTVNPYFVDVSSG